MKKKAEVKIEVKDDSRTNEALQEKISLLSSVNVALIKLLKKIHPAWRADYDALLEKL